jgi:hypothetical protein
MKVPLFMSAASTLAIDSEVGGLEDDEMESTCDFLAINPPEGHLQLAEKPKSAGTHLGWRREAGIAGKRAMAFVPVTLPTLTHAAPIAGADRGLIEIKLAGGRRIRATGAVETDALGRVIAVLEGR